MTAPRGLSTVFAWLTLAAGLVVAAPKTLATAAASTASPDGGSCERLASLTLTHTTMTAARLVGAGELVVDGVPAGLARSLPTFCRVAATLTPTSDSDIKIEVWLPAAGWNGKLEAVGNGGWAGAINYQWMAQALRAGYATTSTDTGHRGTALDGSFALGHPEKLVDFGYRSVHEMTLRAKEMVSAFYGNAPQHSYWNGCSTGGKQALTEAQRFPDDYDGIVAGAPANNWVALMSSLIWIGQATLKDTASLIPREKFELLHKASVDACDLVDGVKDGLLQDPTRCRFDPQTIECKDADAPTCLTRPQVEAARRIYAGPKNPRTGELIFPGLEPGSEGGWVVPAGGPTAFPIVTSHFQHVVFKNPGWDFRTLNFDSDVALAQQLDADVLTAVNPDLTKFASRRGKLIQFHGWNDPLIAPRNSVNYYGSVVKKMGGAAKTQEWYRLFMAPGMGHCGGGDGPDAFDAITALEAWVERGQAPDQIVAGHQVRGTIDRTRPLCPYPQTARYKGTGSIDEAVNFVCAAP